ncbi:diguanylate cyclase (GGDEF)-like protein [Kineococcus xinjiangensis]|uniref:Diguanylate cyclase (GGDEF)-like protein n=1 Tax=Kineococcus xinjiangensis TaxID=512762 RepID=A0A2S6IVK5_9ACTN|nr:diguanylate cyclase [Kineococcus xinjiangensis]PPK98392.1 diguanylate cyclase (GGDEF)-like protein [Kineococcus xinjiangensis]
MTTGVVVAVFLAAALICVGTAFGSWRRRDVTPAATALAVLLSGAATWAASAGVLHAGMPPVLEQALVVLAYPAKHVMIAATVMLSWAVVDPAWRPRRRTVVGLSIVPVLVTLVAATNPLHGQFFRAIAPTGVYPEVEFGPAFWAHTAYSYALLGYILVRLGREWWRASSIFRKQIGSIILATLLPTGLNAVTLSQRVIFHGVDYTPVFFVFTGALMARALFRQGLLQVVPVARSQVVDTLEDAVLVIDHSGRLVDANTAARSLVRGLRKDLPEEIVGLSADEIFHHEAVRPLLEDNCQRTLELARGLHMDLRSRVHLDDRGHLLARVVTARDVSDLVLADRRLREQLSTIQDLQERLQEDAIRDPLTGLHNRRHLMAVLDAVLATGDQVGLVILDVDHFKSVNDTHGHQTGDDVLVAVAHSLLEGTREGDTVARYGGEEFVVLLPGAGVEATMRRAEQIRARCQATKVPIIVGEDPRTLSVTISAGVAVHPADGADARALVAAADAALYAAKAGGRNRVVCATS